MVRKAFDKPPIEVCKTQERLDFLTVLRNWPVHDTCNLDGVHLHLSLRHNEPQVLDPCSLEFALFGAKIESVQPQVFEDQPQDSSVLC
jgi:hypothetical protein